MSSVLHGSRQNVHLRVPRPRWTHPRAADGVPDNPASARATANWPRPPDACRPPGPGAPPGQCRRLHAHLAKALVTQLPRRQVSHRSFRAGCAQHRPHARGEKVRTHVEHNVRLKSQRLAHLKNRTAELERKLSDTRLSLERELAQSAANWEAASSAADWEAAPGTADWERPPAPQTGKRPPAPQTGKRPSAQSRKHAAAPWRMWVASMMRTGCRPAMRHRSPHMVTAARIPAARRSHLRGAPRSSSPMAAAVPIPRGSRADAPWRRERLSPGCWSPSR